jgi:hypothetical protein
MSNKTFFEELAEAIQKGKPDIKYTHLTLEFALYKEAVDYKSYAILPDLSKLTYKSGFNYNNMIQLKEHYIFTQTQFPIHKNWNKAIFTLYPDNKVEMEYIWDQELQDEIELLNKEG